MSEYEKYYIQHLGPQKKASMLKKKHMSVPQCLIPWYYYGLPGTRHRFIAARNRKVSRLLQRSLKCLLLHCRAQQFFFFM